MKIAIVTPEAVPFSKTGGLADATGTLFKEYKKMGLDAYLFVPLYKRTKEQFGENLQDTGIEINIPLGETVKKCKAFKTDHAFFISNDEFFYRDDLYGTSLGDYPDNDMRFIFFCKSVMEICKILSLRLDVIHCNDWQTGLIPLYLKTLYKDIPLFRNATSVFTIHNMGYQGLFPSQTMEITGLGLKYFSPESMEFYGKVNFLKAGIMSADIITTVSRTYANEILTPEAGYGLDGLLREKANSIFGILNGIDYDEWNPSKDRLLPKTYNKSDLSGKTACKKEFSTRCSLNGNTNTPLLCFIGRLAYQKGLDLLIGAIPKMIEYKTNVVIIGKGEEKYNSQLNSLMSLYDGNFFFYSGFNEDFAHLAYAGSDIFLMPSRYEPCGLGQMISMRYGTIPVASKTGGLADTIEDSETGFLFDEYSAESLLSAIKRALTAYSDMETWQALIKNAMNKDFSWSNSARMYLEIYSTK
ncbi:MAG: glycogen synthase GlgA [Thermodesulfovibrionales bacterium]|nr:glycogen synthase GlgA [Thermodesulfovibrionales bacterium]